MTIVKSQESSFFDVNTNEYQKRIFREFRKLRCYCKSDEYRILFIYHLELKDHSREIFTNNDLLENLEFIFHKWQKSFPSNDAIIYNEELNITAHSDNLKVTCIFNSLLFDQLLKHVLNNKIEQVFRISGTNARIYFAIKNNNVYVMRVEPDNFSIQSLDEFVQCCWDEFLNCPPF